MTMQAANQTPTPAAAAQGAADAAAAAAAAAQGAAVASAAASAENSYYAARAARDELRNQLDALVGQRHSLLRELEDHGEVGGPATAGMQQRIVQLDGRIAQLDIAVATADAAVAAAAAVPGAVIEPPRNERSGPPEEVFFIMPILLTFAMLPLIIAYARRIWRRGGAPAPAQLPSDLGERLARLEAMGETTALEVERIGEGQRFVTRLMTERSGREIGEGVPIVSDR
jgi:hypothetical protein